MYLGADGEVDRDRAINGPLAAGIPGHIAALAHIAERYGRLPLARSLQPAIRLATQGFPVDEKYHTVMRFRADTIRRWPAAAEALLVDGEVPEVGELIRLPDLARTLTMVAENGPRAFYEGAFAERLAAGVRAAGGIWSAADLATYRVREREPIRFDYRGHEIVTAPPPSSGGVALAEILNIVAPYDLASLPRAQQVHLLVEAMRRAYRDRGIYLGDPDFVDMPIRMLTSRDYAAGLRASIRLDRATDSDALAGFADAPKGEDTTHYSIIDTDGNMVAATQTVNLPFGAAFMVPGTGFVLNNEMDDFSAKPGAPNAFGLLGYTANAIAPGKRMLSSMTPTFVFAPDRQAALGTPGGSRIITMVLLGVLDLVAGHDPEHWVSLPRFHHQYRPDVISIEPGAFTPALIGELEALGHDVQARDSTWGNMHGVLWRRESGAVSAGSDPRWPSGRAIVR
jgi:gamma-glutamyltranspeptidase/glutathione hydrolase